MPYRTNADLPNSVQMHLPPHAQDIYREAFNHAFAAHTGDPRQEEASHRIAWAAVKRSYVKIGGSWVARTGSMHTD
jgi:cation transport regulator